MANAVAAARSRTRRQGERDCVINSSPMWVAKPIERSEIEPEMHDVAVGDDIVPAFQAQATSVSGTSLPAQFHVVIISDRLGPNEATFEVGVDNSRRFRCAGALGDRPGPRLLGADGEI